MLTNALPPCIERHHAALDESPLANAAYDEPEYDANLGMPGMHTVRRTVALQERSPCISPDLFAKYADASFWLRPDLNRRGVTIL